MEMVERCKRSPKWKGFTLPELIIAVCIVLVLAVVISIFLLSHIERSKISKVVNSMDNIRIAFASAYTKNVGITDQNGDLDYLDDLIRMGFLSNFRPEPDCSVWKVRRDIDIYGRSAYYLVIDISRCPPSDFIRKMMNTIDQTIDDGDSTKGVFRYTM